MKVLERKDKISKKGEKMWSVKLDDGSWYDAYKFAPEYAVKQKGEYRWAVPMESAGSGTTTQREDANRERNDSIERQNACRHAATVVAAFIKARPELTTKEVDALVLHYFSTWHKLIQGKEGE